ncbi:unnamed protein product [Scytosiphon promiscuus]
MCILFLYHALGESDNDDPPLASMDFSAAAKSASVRGRSQGIRGRYKLIAASNRDEILDRATSPIHFWEDANSSLLAGRDLVAGGTWLGVSRSGKFASVTNIPSTWDTVLEAMADGRWTSLASLAYRASGGRGWSAVEASLSLLNSAIFSSPRGSSLGDRRSRGGLVADFLKGDETAEDYCARLSKARGRRYGGFNLVVTDPTGAWLLSNGDGAGITRLEHGFYGVSNATLDAPWPKMVHGKSRVLQVLLRLAADKTLTEDALVDLLMDVLADEAPCPPQPSRGPSGRVPKDCWPSRLRVCVPPSIEPGTWWAWPLQLPWFEAAGKPPQGRAHGTRSSTVVLIDAAGRTKVVERNLGRGNVDGGSGGGGGKGEDGSSEEMLLPMRYAKRTTFEFCDV